MAYDTLTSKSKELWREFCHISKPLLDDIDPNEIRTFYDEWVRKIIHARLAEFIKCYTISLKESKSQHVKGGQTLRDELYCLTKRKKNNSVEEDVIATACEPTVHTSRSQLLSQSQCKKVGTAETKAKKKRKLKTPLALEVNTSSPHTHFNDKQCGADIPVVSNEQPCTSAALLQRTRRSARQIKQSKRQDFEYD